MKISVTIVLLTLSISSFASDDCSLNQVKIYDADSRHRCVDQEEYNKKLKAEIALSKVETNPFLSKASIPLEVRNCNIIKDIGAYKNCVAKNEQIELMKAKHNIPTSSEEKSKDEPAGKCGPGLIKDSPKDGKGFKCVTKKEFLSGIINKLKIEEMRLRSSACLMADEMAIPAENADGFKCVSKKEFQKWSTAVSGKPAPLIDGCEGGELSGDGTKISCPNGYVYRLDTSINQIQRAVIKDVKRSISAPTPKRAGASEQ